MNLIFTTFKKILFWSYNRSTWQYDLLCVLILAFIFLVPNAIFNKTGRSTTDHAVATREVIKETSKPEDDSPRGDKTEKSLPDRQSEGPADKPRD